METPVNKCHLLITARDPATALSFLPLIATLENHPKIDVTLIAQSPGAEILFEHFSGAYHVFNDQQSEQLLATLHSEKPFDAVLVGISGPDIGIDEVALSFSDVKRIKCFALQGFWGDFNPTAKALPTHVFTLDSLATSLNQQRFPHLVNIEIGSLKHAEFEQIDGAKFKYQYRHQIGIEDDETIVGFYGQPLQDLQGYRDTIENFVKALNKWHHPFKLQYRPHPKEPEELQQFTQQLLEQYLKGQYFLDPHADIKASISVCDLVTSAFSTCCIDNVYLNKFSSKPLSCSVFLWYEEDLISWWQEYSQMTTMPMSGEKGLIFSVDRKQDIIPILTKALNAKEIMKNKAKESLPDASQSVMKIIDSILAE